MRRFLIWSGLAALIGLVLAIAGVWAYGHFYARFQPVTIDRNQGEVERLLAQSSWISETEGGEPAVYVIGAPTDPALRGWLGEEGAKLRAAGAQVRVVAFLPAGEDGRPQGTAADRAALAELWLGRDPRLLQQWLASAPGSWKAPGLAPADGNLARSAVAGAGAGFARDLAGELGRAGVQVRWPMVIWRDREGFLRACACSDRRSWAFVRDELNAPDAIGRDAAPALPLEPDVEEVPATPLPAPLPYPQLGPSPAPSPAPEAATPPAATPTPAPAERPAARPAPPSRLERPTPRPAPAKREPSRPRPPEEEDTRFY
ncbi:hypothetical protein ACO2Q1_09440 [Brevundimonas sp. VNH65]|uniref:hypothetical protein n=1 Tax=Brevundimonas sp. VNH65 TaxID=3400917 RepID=UPI003C045D65